MKCRGRIESLSALGGTELHSMLAAIDNDREKLAILGEAVIRPDLIDTHSRLAAGPLSCRVEFA
jgi:hypothetical protein